MRKKDLNSEYSLMDGFRAGHQKCFAEVFSLLYSSLCHYSLKFTGDTAASEDIVEDSFIKIWSKRNIFYDVNILKSYFYSTVRNASLDWIKKNKRTMALSESKANEVETEEINTFEYALEAEVYERLAKAIEQLPNQGKKIIKMIFFEGKKNRVVAEELGISQSTVKTHKERAIIAMQKQLARK